MMWQLSTGVVPFIPMRFPCEVLFVVPESSEDKETSPDWLHKYAADEYYKIKQNKGSDTFIFVLQSSHFFAISVLSSEIK